MNGWYTFAISKSFTATDSYSLYILHEKSLHKGGFSMKHRLKRHSLIMLLTVPFFQILHFSLASYE